MTFYKVQKQEIMTNEELRKWIRTEDENDAASLQTIHVLFEAWQMNMFIGDHSAKKDIEECIEIQIKKYWGKDAKAIFDDKAQELRLEGSYSRLIIMRKITQDELDVSN